MPPDVLESEFAKLVASRSIAEVPRRAGRSTSGLISKAHLQDWVHDKIVPWWDIQFWAKTADVTPTLTEIGEWMFGPNCPSPEKLAHKAEERFKEASKIFQSLVAQGNAER